ncbi:para-aminobenzoate synthase, (PABA) [Microbotryomycetes sp. JL221]|nr:para-aminobenzoate synthase, (PABA) [Microbotryomycetes sp. JL221]
MSVGHDPQQQPQHVPTTVVLEHHDSYTRNLLALFAQVVKLDHGMLWNNQTWQERVVVINVDSLSWNEFVDHILPHVDCVILGPGPGSPHHSKDFSWPTRLINEFGHKLPMFGLCLGHQGLATTFGASVVQAFAPRHGQVTTIQHNGDELYDNVPNNFKSVQYNSLTVDPNSIPKELIQIAWTNNKLGHREVLGLKHGQKPLWGVQYHLESICSDYGARTLSNFLRLALRHHQQIKSSNTSTQKVLPESIRKLSTSIMSKQKLSNNKDDKLWQRKTVSLGCLPGLTTTDVFTTVIKGTSSLGEVWLDSARASGQPQASHMIIPKSTWSYELQRKRLIVKNKQSTIEHDLRIHESFFNYLDQAQKLLQTRTQEVDVENVLDSQTVPLGFVGFLGYEMREESMPLSMRFNRSKDEPPQSEFALADSVLTYLHENQEWIISGLVRTSEFDPVKVSLAPLVEFGLDQETWLGWIETVRDKLVDRQRSFRLTHEPEIHCINPPVPVVNSDDYIDAIKQAQSKIRSGDTYELCLTTQFKTTISNEMVKDPFNLYLSLRKFNPAPYSYYFNLPKSNLVLLSSSPERFMKIDNQGQIEMKPIKGTIKRDRMNTVQDEKLKQELSLDEKERAENLMIVDLSRNDLLATCDVDSVQVPKLMVVETYETVHQLVTSVVGTLKHGIGPVQAVEQAFPPGSMTGAPKLRSLQILHELEDQRPRGVYSGAFGFISYDGATDLSVVIRTIVLRGQELTLGAGGAITNLSDPHKEWQEVLVKVDAVTGSIASEQAQG